MPRIFLTPLCPYLSWQGIIHVSSCVDNPSHKASPNEDDKEAVTRILRYLKMTPEHWLLFQTSDNREMEICMDASCQERTKINYWLLLLCVGEFGDLEEQKATNGL